MQNVTFGRTAFIYLHENTQTIYRLGSEYIYDWSLISYFYGYVVKFTVKNKIN